MNPFLPLRRLTRSLLRRWLRRVPLPVSFQQVSNSRDDLCVVAQSKSCVIAALLDAFADKTSRGGTAEYARPGAVRSENGIRWVSLHDTAALSALLAKNPRQQLTTLNIFERRGPLRTNPTYENGLFQLLEIVLSARRLLISFGNPRAVADAEGATNEIAPKLARRAQRQLKLDFFRNLKVVRGIPFQPIAIQERLVLSGPDFEREIGIVSTKMRISRSRAMRKASGEFRSIAANPIRPLYSFASSFCRMITKRLFRQITTQGMDRFVAAAKENAVVLVPMHRSHFDYLLVGQKLYESNIIPPVVAAGVNLSFFPVGFLIRSLGAYFVKRNARQDKLHALVLRRYVTYLIKRGHLQEFFIEGGRSRSGRMRAPKVGLLGTMIEAFLKGLRRDIMFVPVSITYENVVEDKTFGDENTGQKKKKESLLELLKARSIFRNRYGDVVISFGEPISLVGRAERLFGKSGAKAGDSRALIRDVAHLLTVKIRGQTSVSLTALAYTALMASPGYGLPRTQLADSIRNLSRIAGIAREIDPGIGDFTPTLTSFLEGSELLLDDLLRGGVMRRGFALSSEIFYLPGKYRFTADFYKNALFHLFFPISLFSALQCVQSSFSPEDAIPFRAVFADDMLLPPEDEFLEELRRWAEMLADQRIFCRAGEDRYHFADRSPGLFLPELFLASVESFLWCFRCVQAAVAAESNAGERRPVAYKKVLERAQTEFRVAQYVSLVTRTEASAQSSLQAALEILAQRGIISIEDKGGTPNEVKLLREDAPEIHLFERLRQSIVSARNPSPR